jgi:hypothetical protein
MARPIQAKTNRASPPTRAPGLNVPGNEVRSPRQNDHRPPPHRLHPPLTREPIRNHSSSYPAVACLLAFTAPAALSLLAAACSWHQPTPCRVTHFGLSFFDIVVLLLRYPISFQSLTHSLCENTGMDSLTTVGESSPNYLCVFYALLRHPGYPSMSSFRFPFLFGTPTNPVFRNPSLFMTPSYKLPPIATLAAPRNPSLWTWHAKSRSEERTCQNQRRLQNQIRVIMSPD